MEIQGIGIFSDVDEQEYRDYKAINQSLLKLCEKSVGHFRYYYDRVGIHEEEGEKEDALLIGTAVHAAVLEPKKFKERYINAGINGKNLKAYKEIVSANPEKIVLTKKQYEICLGSLDSIAKTETARQLLEVESLNEVSAICEHVERIVGTDLKLLLKSRVDRYVTLNKRPCLIDLKTTIDASPQGFPKSIASFGYHIQGAFYTHIFEQLTGEPHKDFIIIAIEKIPPFAVAVYKLTPEDLKAGRVIFKKWLYDIANATHYNEWSLYPDTIANIRLPHWAYSKKD